MQPQQTGKAGVLGQLGEEPPHPTHSVSPALPAPESDCLAVLQPTGAEGYNQAQITRVR